MTNLPIKEALLRFIHKQTGRRVIYEQEPIPLLGGLDATTTNSNLEEWSRWFSASLAATEARRKLRDCRFIAKLSFNQTSKHQRCTG
jgi:hypothetical protein